MRRRARFGALVDRWTSTSGVNGWDLVLGAVFVVLVGNVVWWVAATLL